MTRRYVTRTGRTIERNDDFRETIAPPMSGYESTQIDEPVYVATERDRTLTGLELFVGWIAGIVNILLVVRFFLSLFAANQANGFANFIYTTTNGLVAPFQSLFNVAPSSGLGYFDLPAVVAIAVISLVSWALMRVLRIGRV